MALINSGQFDDLAKNTSGMQTSTPGMFYSIFITGEMRTGQRIGTLQCMSDFDGGKYFINNADTVGLIPLFSKKYWVKKIEIPNERRPGDTIKQIVAFGWNDDEPKLDDGCKYEHLIAGQLFDMATNSVVRHSADVKDTSIKANDPVLAYIRLSGIKFGSVFDWSKEVEAKTKSLIPLSDKPDFEKKVIAWRRHILPIGVKSVPSNHGNKMVFDLSKLGAQIPDDKISGLMTLSQTLTPEFEKQFKKVPNAGNSSSRSNGPSDSAPSRSFKQNESAGSGSGGSGKALDLGI